MIELHSHHGGNEEPCEHCVEIATTLLIDGDYWVDDDIWCNLESVSTSLEGSGYDAKIHATWAGEIFCGEGPDPIDAVLASLKLTIAAWNMRRQSHQ